MGKKSISKALKGVLLKKQDDGKIKKYQADLESIKQEVSKVVVGQEEVVNGVLRGILANGHVLIEGLPGVAKTLLVRALATSVGGKFNRIQFTVDLLPTDITGITAYDKTKGFYTVKGPIFANFVMADEVNRAPPKTQSALLEAMQEKQVTIGKDSFRLDEPFFVMATQNPIESAGVYNLPEAQIDRFLFKVNMPYPKIEEEQLIMAKNISLSKFEDFKLKPVISPKRVIELQGFVKNLYISEDIKKYITRIVDSTRNPEKYKIKTGKFIQYGASPRATIGLFIAAKTEALLNGRSYVIPQDIKTIASDVLRHRILLNYEGEAEGIKSEEVILEILKKVPV